MPSWRLNSTHSLTTSGVACYHRPWITYTVELRRAWHAIISLRMNTQYDDVRHGSIIAIGSTYGQTWHTIISIGQHMLSNDVKSYIPSSPLHKTHGEITSAVACHQHPWTTYTGMNDVKHGLQSSPLESIHGRRKSGVTFYNCLWTAHTLRRRWVWLC